MTDRSESDAVPGGPPQPIAPLRPKRGAFPTPKSEIDKATPYVPDMGDEDGGTEGSPGPPAAAEGEENG